MRHTMVFEADDIPPTPYGTATDFGKVVVPPSIGDLAAQCDELLDCMETIKLRGDPESKTIAQSALSNVRLDIAQNAEAAERARRQAYEEAKRQVGMMLAAMEQAEAIMSIVEPRSDKAEYLRILGVVREAIAVAKGGAP